MKITISAKAIALGAVWCLAVGCVSGPNSPTQSQAASVLSWNRDGGFAGFCDELKVSASGDYAASSCKATSGPKNGKLSSGDLAQLNGWLGQFGPVVIDSKDSAAADAMTIKLTLAGKGTGKPSDSERQQLLDWTQRVFTQAK